jgi:RNA polymerase sigma-70 factor (ECF subfamily)
MVIHGAAAVAKQARIGLRAVFARPIVQLRPALVNGAAGVVVTLGEEPMTVMGFTVAEGRIVEIDAIADPERVRRVAAEFFVDE